jgi:hypothetical protein
VERFAAAAISSFGCLPLPPLPRFDGQRPIASLAMKDDDRADHLRTRAVEAEALADCFTDPLASRSMREVAKGYERLAELSRKTAHKQMPRSGDDTPDRG